MSVTVFAPATIANLGVGFDLLGAAIVPADGSLLGDRVTVEPADQGIDLRCIGDWVKVLPGRPEENIVYQCAERFLELLPENRRCGLRLTLEKGLPVGSGLGSSASSVVAALSALNEFFDRPFGPEKMLPLMGELEGRVSGSVHYDNVAPAYLGGMQLLVQSGDHFCEPVPFFEHWFWVVAYPGTTLSTAKMRELLPAKYDRSDLIKYGRYLSGFIHALYKKDQNLALAMINDVVAEPYRSSHIPGYIQAKAALAKLGMIASGISGSGPTIFAIAETLHNARQAEEWLNASYLAQSGGFVKVCRIDRNGARRV
ncbi:MAG: homoserine kinase [Candidatus Rifleibacteriota bacterium]